MPTLDEILQSFAPTEAQKRAARQQALMTAGLGLLGTPKGQEWRGVGRAGLLGIADYNEQLAQGVEQKMRNLAMAQQIMRLQQEEEQRRMEQERQQAFAKARADSVIPGTPGMPQMGPPTAQGEMQPAIAPVAPRFDLETYANKVMPLDFKEAASALMLKKQLAPVDQIEKINPEKFTAPSVAKFAISHDYGDLVEKPKEVKTKLMSDGRSQWLVNEATGEQIGTKIPVQMSLEQAARLSLDWAKFNQEKAKATIKATPGQNELDKAFAKDYAEFKAGGGIADINKQLQQLREAANSVKTGNLSGPLIGNIPDRVLAMSEMGQKAMAARDAVLEVAQRNLRQVLGAQFTQKEGEMLLARTYNPLLPPAENKKRIDRLAAQIEAAAKAKQDAANYFEEKGTLVGWKGKLYSIADFMPESAPATNSPGGWSVVREK